jgi:predicted PurR-regulated permease PerM
LTQSKQWVVLGLLMLTLVIIYFLSAVLTPFLVAGLLAYLTDPIVNRLQAWKLPRTIAIIFVFLLVFAVFTLLVLYLVPLLEKQLLAFLHNTLPKIIQWMQEIALPWFYEKFGITEQINLTQMTQAISAHWEKAGGVASVVLNTIFSSGSAIVGLIINLLLIPVVLFYLLRDWDGLLAGVHHLLPRRIEQTTVKLVSQCNEVLSAFLRGQLMVMIGLGTLYSIGLSIVGLNLALLIGIVSGLVSIVPYLGLILGLSAAIIAGYLQFASVMPIIYIGLVFLLAQAIEAAVLTPLFVGEKIGLHPVAVIFAILAGGELFGFVGVLLALPVAAVIMVFIRYFKQCYVESQWYAKATSEDLACHNN